MELSDREKDLIVTALVNMAKAQNVMPSVMKELLILSEKFEIKKEEPKE